MCQVVVFLLFELQKNYLKIGPCDKHLSIKKKHIDNDDGSSFFVPSVLGKLISGGYNGTVDEPLLRSGER